jgi:hypothetical protein
MAGRWIGSTGENAGRGERAKEQEAGLKKEFPSTSISSLGAMSDFLC